MVDQQAVIRDVVEILRAQYGPRLHQLILYGSYARGDFHDESDMDFLLILTDETISVKDELQRYGPAMVALTEKHGLVVSVMPTSLHHFQTSKRSIFRFIKQDGIVVFDKNPHFRP
jgi:predicted nucleotidyltransferase